MSWREDYVTQSYISREISQIVNEHGDEIELETIQYHDHYHVIATLCQEEPPFKDYFAEGRDHSERGTIRKALREIYLKAYSR